MTQLATLVGLTALVGLTLSSPSSGGGREITYSDFLRTLLPSGEVERIVVMNKSQAKVVMKRGAEGVFKDGGRGQWNTLSNPNQGSVVPGVNGSPIEQQAAENLKVRNKGGWGTLMGRNEYAQNEA